MCMPCVNTVHFTHLPPRGLTDIELLWLQSGVLHDAAAGDDKVRGNGHARELVSHPIIPTSPSTWDESSVASSPALSVLSPFANSVPAHVTSSSRLLGQCKRTL